MEKRGPKLNFCDTIHPELAMNEDALWQNARVDNTQ